MDKAKVGLVDAHELNNLLKTNSNLVVLHTSMTNPVTGESPIIGEQVIPTSRHFDFEHVFSDISSDLPHTMPSVAKFEKQARCLGIKNNAIIVVYDDIGIYCSPRVWWVFRAMGHQHVYVLDGGFPAWRSHHFDYDNVFSEVYGEGDFCAKPKPQSILNLEQLLVALDEKNTTLVDARSAGRFEGTEPEPRTGVRSGHIPKAKNIPFIEVLTNGYMKSPETLMQLFGRRNIRIDDELVFSCGSGVTACILALAAYQVGYVRLSVYDGSWSEWEADKTLPIELGKPID